MNLVKIKFVYVGTFFWNFLSYYYKNPSKIDLGVRLTKDKGG